ncbi:DUF2523 domain-containing protein [Neisseria sp. ZJ106]|uniref:DUF2523 family protein n=1 Tax=Neisseria lisongii TaxID=2912188 RepID=A0ABY7RIZ5_9NEIS|nr:DUF2523 family protein [Neisseria lisongii]MCF7521963.1 DUF2523 domain-containing protein [Neisseria lisongii]WCL71337.1 DUF2523 family protein [Neisseria lisongii]WCL72331.1 DUF2523 family protein [Neisseria lisongii]
MWAKLLTGVLTTVAGKIFTALGMSFISYVGINEIQDMLMNAVSEQLGGLSQDALQIAYIAGVGVCLNWIFGTFAFITSLKTLSKLSATMVKK